MFLRGALIFAAVLVSASGQVYDYSSLQTSLNLVAAQAEKKLQSYRVQISELVLTTTDEMIMRATNSLSEDGDDPKAPMIGACTLYPTNYLNHYTKELNVKVAEAQSQVNSMKFGILRGLMNQPMITEPDVTFTQVQAQVLAMTSSWPTTKSALETEIAAYKVKVDQLVVDMQECIDITDV